MINVLQCESACFALQVSVSAERKLRTEQEGEQI